jgi:NAD(P)H-dependent FMN reductase
MGKKVIGIVGSYRKGSIIDSAIDTTLTAAAEKGVVTEKIYLIDQHIEFCKNCRICTQAEGPQRGVCVQKDDMDNILTKIENADAVVIGSPVNFGNVTAVTQRFIERLVCYGYWPWGKPGPVLRVKDRRKKAVLVTSSAMPAFMGRFFTSALRSLKGAATTLGATPIGSLYIGKAALYEKQELPPDIASKAKKLGHELATDG